MKIEIAEKAGFCFGVARAVKIAYELAEKPGKHACYGMLIHNRDVTEDLRQKGIPVVEDLNEIFPGTQIIIRAHGISKAQQEHLEDCGAQIVDATCPYVKKIHKIVEKAYHSGRRIVICGDSEHPEVRGINGWCDNSAIIVGCEDDVEKV